MPRGQAARVESRCIHIHPDAICARLIRALLFARKSSGSTMTLCIVQGPYCRASEFPHESKLVYLSNVLGIELNYYLSKCRANYI